MEDMLTPLPRLIGLTGAYCAGKNYAAAMLSRRGVPVLDVDKLGHEALKTEREAIAARFGGDILGPEGAVGWRRLGEKVFGKPTDLAALETIVHPAANRLTCDWVRSQEGGKICVINAALLHRSAVFDALEAVIIIEAPFLIRLWRARRRDGLPWLALLKRFRSQRTFASQYSQKKADIYRVENSGFFRCRGARNREALEKQLAGILAQLEKTGKT